MMSVLFCILVRRCTAAPGGGFIYRLWNTGAIVAHQRSTALQPSAPDRAAAFG